MDGAHPDAQQADLGSLGDIKQLLSAIVVDGAHPDAQQADLGCLVMGPEGSTVALVLHKVCFDALQTLRYDMVASIVNVYSFAYFARASLVS